MLIDPDSENEAKKDVLVAKLAFRFARQTDKSWEEFMDEHLENHVETLKDLEEFDQYYEYEN